MPTQMDLGSKPIFFEDGWMVRLTRTPETMCDGIEVRIVNQNKLKFISKITFEETKVEKPSGQMMPSIVNLPLEHAQYIMDELYKIGIRPTKGQGSIGQLEAVQYHLEDMRKLVFK